MRDKRAADVDTVSMVCPEVMLHASACSPPMVFLEDDLDCGMGRR